MLKDREIAEQLYVAFECRDADRLIELLHSDFVGHVSQGMPGGVGGTHAGPAAMLTDVWIPIARRFAARPVPERFLSCDTGEMVVLGHYRGQPPGSGRAFVAAFAHELVFRDGRIAELRQITDTQQWVNAVRDGAVEVVERMFAAVAHRDGAALMDIYARDVAITEPSSLPYGGDYHGHDGAAEHARGFVSCWDAWQTSQDRDMQPVIVPDGQRVVVVWRLKATGPRGARLDVPVVDLIEVRDGKVARLQMFHGDTTTVRQFLHDAATASG